MDNLARKDENHGNSHFDSSSIMSCLPLHLIDEILFRLELTSIAMLRCTNKSINSYLTDSRFGPKHPSWARRSLFHLSSYGDMYVNCLPLVFSCDSRPPGRQTKLSGMDNCYMFGSCSGLLLLYIGCLFVANPVTKRFRILDHSGSKLIPKIVGGDNERERPITRTERAMCVGFAVNQNQTTKRFKIVGILEMETMYGFEINDGGDSWRLSETTITTSTKSDLTIRVKPVYLDNTLHWLRNDGSIIAFNPETEQARFIPSIHDAPFIPQAEQARLLPPALEWEPNVKLHFAEGDKINSLTLIWGTKETITVYTLVGNHKWAVTRRIKNVVSMEYAVSMEEKKIVCWNMVGYDGKFLIVRVRVLGCLEAVVHAYDMEANSWGFLGSTPNWICCVRDFYKFTPSLFFVEENEQQKVIVASNDQRISDLFAVMGLIDTTN